MAGYIHDPLQIINLITDNLRDRYKSGFPVLKEIIQNADDAGSANESVQLEFGLSAGLPNAEHTLLKGPALYFLNNGAFSDSDYKAIRSFGLNRKAIEQSTIGKFGLGMKSVFHFCEAFFFLARNNDKEYAEILNPWSGDELSSFQDHNDWDNFSTFDTNLIREYVRPVLDCMDLSRGSFFLLWLPLRQKRHLMVNGKEVGCIINEFHGDNNQQLAFLFKQELAQQIASLLPLLRRIDRISFWQANGATTVEMPHFQVSMKGTSRIGLADGQYQSKDLEGMVIYQYNGKDDTSYTLTYSGKEKSLGLPELLALRDSHLWPKSYVRDDLGKSCEAPDKARGHSAVVFSRSNEKEHGKLKIRWAVFLPVDAAKEEILCGGDCCYQITLHGYFFVDAGRVGIEGLQEGSGHIDTTTEPQNEVELRRLWNIRLLRSGTLPLVIPALEAFIVKARLSPDDIWHLSEGIRSSKFFSPHRKCICVDSSWVCSLTPKGRKWYVLSNAKKILPLPEPPSSASERPWKTLPKLELFEKRGFALLLKNAPHLLACSLPQWSEENLLEVLSFPENEVFTDQGCLDYLLQFLEESVNPFHKISTIQAKLRQIANRAFIALGINLRQNRKKVQEFVAYILPENRYPLKPDATQVICELQHCKIDVLILAQEFDSPNSAGTAQLGLNDALVLLKKLHELITHFEQQNDQEMTRHCSSIAKDILNEQGDEQRQALLFRANGLKILEGYDCIQEKFVALSPADLNNRRKAMLLFLYSQGVNDVQRRGLAPKLQGVIKDNVVLINSRTAELVFGRNNDLSPCQADSILDSLGSEAKPLQGIDKRRQLLPEVAGTNLTTQRRVKGLRYLIHGLEKYYDDVGTLWVSGYDQSPIWGKLWQQLGSYHEDGWNLIDRKLVDEIPPNKWSTLSIREIKPDGILEELRVNGTDGIAGEQFAQDERYAVLKELVSDENLWKNLPFHETVNGKLVCITDGKSFLGTDLMIPEELLQNADIIKRSNDPTIRRQQQEWLSPLYQEGLIRIALQHSNPKKFWRLIMDNLDAAHNLLTAPLLRDTPWLPDNNLASVKPSDVLYLDKMQDDVDRLLTAARGSFWSPGKLFGDLQQHKLFTLLKEKSFATGREGFEKLALLLGETNEYHVGKLVYHDADFDRIVQIYSRLPVHLSLPGWALFSRAMNTSQEMAKEFLLPEILKPIDLECIIDILCWLQEEHTKAGHERKKDILTAFNSYLSASVNSGISIEKLSSFLLLNREGSWKAANELCAGVDGIDDAYLLDEKQKYILTNIICKSSEYEKHTNSPYQLRIEDQEIKQSVVYLRKYFSSWEGLVSDELICAFLMVLGDEKEIYELAKQYQGRHSISWIRNQLSLNTMNSKEAPIDRAFSGHKFVIKIHADVKAKVYSILGNKIDTLVSKRYETLIIGGVYDFQAAGYRASRIYLRSIDPEEKTQSELASLLKYSGPQNPDNSIRWLPVTERSR